eukprot:XP_011670932.1 PREDICTED: uncharacterized protein LOC105441495 [Strongylocentrotus purpuratus]
MAAFFRKTHHHSCQVQQHINRCLMKRYGTDNRVKLKTFGLVSCLQMQHKTATASSGPDRPELQAARIAGNPLGVESACYLTSNSSSELSDFDNQVFKCKASVNKTNCGTSQRTTSTVEENEGFTLTFSRKRIAHQSQQQQSQSDDVSTMFAYKRKSATKSGFIDHADYLSSNNFLKQRASGGFWKDSPVRHYAMGPRSQHRKEKSYYEVLNTTPSATQAQVKEAYFKLSKIYHPDKNAGSKEAQRKFALINEAYSVLGNLTLRKRYDRGTLNQRDVHGEVKPEEKAAEEGVNRDPMYTSSGMAFSMEAKRQAKNMDDFFSKHYQDARDKEQRNRAERQQRIDEYMDLQRRARLSPLFLAACLIGALAMAVTSIARNDTVYVEKEQPGANKETK